jgi:NAD(P)-dependent dehydrogenase (short-subunit alcohol dehydrogenase family)
MSILNQFRLNGKRVLITGGSRGLGRAMAQALAEAGADLVLVGRDAGTLSEAQRELTGLDRMVDIIAADLFDPKAVAAMCEQVLSQHGPIDVLINNVGGRRENIPLVEQSLADWQKLMDLNLTSAVVCTQKLAPPMLERGWGRIINIASICGQIATRNIHGRHYETAKAAVVGLTKSCAADWAPRGVTVNAIAPGGFMTDANRRWFRERPEFQKEVENIIPMGRLGNPEELGPLAVYLASNASSYMTGALLVIDGGYTLW